MCIKFHMYLHIYKYISLSNMLICISAYIFLQFHRNTSYTTCIYIIIYVFDYIINVYKCIVHMPHLCFQDLPSLKLFKIILQPLAQGSKTILWSVTAWCSLCLGLWQWTLWSTTVEASQARSILGGDLYTTG